MALAEAVEKWDSEGWGYVTVDGRRRFTHLLWADNIYLISGPNGQMRSMVIDLTTAMLAAGLCWKASLAHTIAWHHPSG